MLRTPKKAERGACPLVCPRCPRLSRADMRPPRDRAAGTQHRRAGARSSFCPLPPWALGRDVALSPTRVQKDQVVAKVGSHCAACARASWGWGWGVRGRVAPRAPVGRVRACSPRRGLAPRAGGRCGRRRCRGSHARRCALPAATPRQDPLPGAARRGHGTRSVDSAGLLIEDHAVELHHLVCAGEMHWVSLCSRLHTTGGPSTGGPGRRGPQHEWRGTTARGRRMGAGRFAIFPRGK